MTLRQINGYCNPSDMCSSIVSRSKKKYCQKYRIYVYEAGKCKLRKRIAVSPCIHNKVLGLSCRNIKNRIPVPRKLLFSMLQWFHVSNYSRVYGSVGSITKYLHILISNTLIYSFRQISSKNVLEQPKDINFESTATRPVTDTAQCRYSYSHWTNFRQALERESTLM
jgi:hypothetical protein